MSSKVLQFDSAAKNRSLRSIYNLDAICSWRGVVRYRLSDAINLCHYGRYQFQRKHHPPIFIVGCGHSGTSLLLAMLGSHSNIHAIPFESGLFFDWKNQRPLIRAAARRIMRAFDSMAVRERKLRWVEKTPKHIMCLQQIFAVRPDAKVILMIRDGRDVAASIQDRFGDFELGIRRWMEDNRAGKEFWSHPNVHLLKYEDLIDSPEATAIEVLTFLDEPFEKEVLDYHLSPRKFYSDNLTKPPDAFGANHEQYRNWQINQPLFDGRGRWKRLTPEQQQILLGHAGQMLAEFGYV